MSFSESEVAVLLAVAAALVMAGLAAWRRGDLGHWYPVAVATSVVALTVDPLERPSYSSLGGIALVGLAAVGLLATALRMHASRISGTAR